MIKKELENIIKRALDNFLKDIKQKHWAGRENEAINLFVFGHLLKEVKTNSILYDSTQIAMECAVQQNPGSVKKQVRKDLIIWHKPGMNCWNENKELKNTPLAIIEWKVKGFRKPNKGELKNSEYDIQWLKAFSKDKKDFIGYAITLDISGGNYNLLVNEVFEGNLINENNK